MRTRTAAMAVALAATVATTVGVAAGVGVGVAGLRQGREKVHTPVTHMDYGRCLGTTFD